MIWLVVYLSGYAVSLVLCSIRAVIEYRKEVRANRRSFEMAVLYWLLAIATSAFWPVLIVLLPGAVLYWRVRE